MNFDSLVFINFAIALGIGLLIGAERERSKGSGLEKTSEGIRTFTIATLLGAVTGSINFWLFIAAIFCVLVFAAIAYYKQLTEHPGITTEIALIFSMILGGLCVSAPDLAASLAVTMAILLAAKNSIHGFVVSILSREELNDFLILAASTVIILPLVPNDFIGPFNAINPRNLWLIVILVMVVGALSHILLRLLGTRIGLPIVGLLSGFISSIATVTTMAERGKETPELMDGAIAGAILSSLATILQLVILLLIVSLPTLLAVKWPLIFGGVSIAVYGVFMSIKAFHGSKSRTLSPPTKTFSATTALMLATVIGAVLIISSSLKNWFGLAGLIAVSGIAGLADVHAPTIAVATLVASGKLVASYAAIPILVAFSFNSFTKACMAAISGTRQFWLPVSSGLMVQVIFTWLGWWFTL
jgi:uncharacterized membrane protein (DUF4010 family)